MKNTITFEQKEALRKIKAEQEQKDFYVTKRLLTDLLSDKVKNLKFQKMREFCGFDMKVTFTYKGKRHKQAFEIKERTKSEAGMKLYPNSELKVQKYDNVMDSAKFYLCNEVYYIQIINNDIAYIYNLKKLNWSNVITKTWKVKTEVYFEDSPTKDYLTHFIPYTEGKKFINLKPYYDDYYKLIA